MVNRDSLCNEIQESDRSFFNLLRPAIKFSVICIAVINAPCSTKGKGQFKPPFAQDAKEIRDTDSSM
jgi:hypothetical protein